MSSGQVRFSDSSPLAARLEEFCLLVAESVLQSTS